jgi:hypothetical protein
VEEWWEYHPVLLGDIPPLGGERCYYTFPIKDGRVRYLAGIDETPVSVDRSIDYYEINVSLLAIWGVEK